MKDLLIATLVAILSIAYADASGKQKHLFILSGQSNMDRLNPETSFTPVVEKEFGKSNIVVVKDAEGGRSIQKWYKQFSNVAAGINTNKRKQPRNAKPQKDGELYDRLMAKVYPELKKTKFTTVTFVWMQGETDTHKGKNHTIYKECLQGLLKQLSDDLKRDDMNFVIGRLSPLKQGQASWDDIRKAQVEVAESSPRGEWVDTDDIQRAGVHYVTKGYEELGKRFAEKAIDLIKKNRK
ncbi:hypothetical protein BVX97_02380 [bacterium E08(2017)]|nr:hypothetical protein BVX97_02380 [bacterium E08(2017)]